MLKAGNRVNFEPGNCYIQNMATGAKTMIEEKGGTFEVGIWVPKKTVINRGAHAIETRNRFAELGEDRGRNESGFARLDEFL